MSLIILFAKHGGKWVGRVIGLAFMCACGYAMAGFAGLV